MARKVLFGLAVCVACWLAAGCASSSDDDGATRAYAVKLSAADEDFVDFGAMASFMNGSSWAILEKVKIPAGSTVGWHFFRGKG